MTNEPLPPLQTVSQVDIPRYLGIWFEIARYPNRFQKDCVASRATYTLRDDGNLSVLNECYDKAKPGKLRSAHGKAWVVDPLSSAKLKVSFFWPFSGDYWIIDLGQEYEYAVVGHPQRKYLWILSREETMEEGTYLAILDRLTQQHYDITKIIKSDQGERTHEIERVF